LYLSLRSERSLTIDPTNTLAVSATLIINERFCIRSSQQAVSQEITIPNETIRLDGVISEVLRHGKNRKWYAPAVMQSYKHSIVTDKAA